jgi:hypothetical protein
LFVALDQVERICGKPAITVGSLNR